MNVQSIKNYEAFVDVARHGSLKAAAAATGASRKTLRTRLADFEADVGVELLRRRADHIVLTPTGSALFEEGRAIFERLKKLIVRGAELRQGQAPCP